MLIILGTLPFENLDIIQGEVKLENGLLKIGNFETPISLGTSALVSSALISCKTLRINFPYFITAGDIGNGKGSKKLYQYIPEYIKSITPKVITMHYLMPNIFGIRRILEALENKRREISQLTKDLGISKDLANLLEPDEITILKSFQFLLGFFLEYLKRFIDECDGYAFNSF